mgnify:CR=1 FL=1
MERDWVSTLLPLAIIGVVFAIRFRNLSKPRPFKTGRLWIAPVLLAGLVSFMISASQIRSGGNSTAGATTRSAKGIRP